MDRDVEMLRGFLDNYTIEEMMLYPFSTRNALLRNITLTREMVPPTVLVVLELEGVLTDDFVIRHAKAKRL